MAPRSFLVEGLALVFVPGMVLAALAQSEAPDDVTRPVRPPEISRIVSAEEALAGAHIPTVDPATMNDAEIRKGVGDGPRCEFRYTSSGKPVLALRKDPAAGAIAGVVKLNGNLVQLQSANGGADGSDKSLAMTSAAVRATLTPLAAQQIDGRASERREMTLLFEIDTRLKVGYRGYYNCLG